MANQNSKFQCQLNNNVHAFGVQEILLSPKKSSTLSSAKSAKIENKGLYKQ